MELLEAVDWSLLEEIIRANTQAMTTVEGFRLDSPTNPNESDAKTTGTI